MLISAKYKNDRIHATYVQRVDSQIRYSRELAKDESNGFTKDRNMRRIASIPEFTLMEYERCHPGWYARITENKDFKDKQKAWREFLGTDYAKPFMMVEKLKH